MQWHACGSVEDIEIGNRALSARVAPAFWGVRRTLGKGTHYTNVYTAKASVFKA